MRTGRRIGVGRATSYHVEIGKEGGLTRSLAESWIRGNSPATVDGAEICGKSRSAVGRPPPNSSTDSHKRILVELMEANESVKSPGLLPHRAGHQEDEHVQRGKQEIA